MADKEKITYEFEDLRRNDDELPPAVLATLGIDDSDDSDSEVHTDDSDGDGDGDGDQEEEMVPMSEVRKRLNRVRREADRKIDAAKGEAAEVIGELQTRVGNIEGQAEVDELEEQNKEQLENINAKIEEAIEAGDTKEATRLTGELAAITATNVTKREQLKAKRKQDEHDEPADLNREARPANPRAKDWLSEQDWWGDPDYRDVQTYVNKVDKALQDKGYKPDEDAFYIELEKAIEKKHPGIILHTMDEDAVADDDDDEFADIPDKRTSRKKRQRNASRRSPAGGETNSTGGKRRRDTGRKGKTLNRTQVANMRTFGMDPTNKEHVEAYLAEVK